MFRFRLNGTIINDQPEGWQDFTESIVRDESLHILTVVYDAELTFVGDGYAILTDLWLNGFCNTTELIIEQDCDGWQTIAELIIIIPDLDENLDRCTVKVSPVDNSYYAFIHNNRQVPVDMRATKTKNGNDMPACPSINVKVFLPELDISENVQYEADSRLAYDQRDALKHILHYITDGRIDNVVSDYMDSLLWNLPQQPLPVLFNCELQDGVVLAGGSEYMGIYLNTGQTQGGAPTYIYQGETFPFAGFPETPLLVRVFNGAEWFWYILYPGSTIQSADFTDPDTPPWDAVWPLPITAEQYCPNVLQEDMSFCFMAGIELRRHTGESFTLTLERVMKTLYTKHNLFGAIEGTALRLEPWSYWFGENGLNQQNASDLTRSIDTSKLYATVAIGSQKSVEDRELIYSMPLYDMLAHTVQEYGLEGDCNTDVRLDLTSDYVYDSNLIEKVITTQIQREADNEDPDQQYDSDIFYIQYSEDKDGNLIAVYDSTFLLPTTPIKGITYNPYLYNSVVITRHTMQSGFAIYQGSSTDNFRVEANSPNSFISTYQGEFFNNPLSLNPAQISAIDAIFGILAFAPYDLPANSQFIGTTYIPIQFDDTTTPPNFDPNGNWDTTNYEFVAPATGVYGFRFVMKIDKVADKVQLYDGTVINIGDHPNPNQNYLQVLDGRIKVNAVIYNTADEVVTENPVSVITGDINNQWLWLNPNGIPLQTAINYPSNSGLQNWRYQPASTIGQNWQSFELNDFKGNVLLYMEAGQKMRPNVFIRMGAHFRNGTTDNYRWVAFGVMPGSYIESTFVQTGGGDFTPEDVNIHKCIQYLLDKPLTLEEWNLIKQDPRLAIGLSTSEINLVDTYIGKITRKFADGDTNFQMITSRNKI